MATQEKEKQWTYDMYRKLLLEYPTKGDVLAEEMGISVKNLKDRADQMGVSIHRPYTEEEKDLFYRYRLKLKNAMIFLMPYRSPAEIGLYK